MNYRKSDEHLTFNSEENGHLETNNVPFLVIRIMSAKKSEYKCPGAKVPLAMMASYVSIRSQQLSMEI